MSRKFFTLALLACFTQLAVVLITGQTSQNEPVAEVKFKLTDFKNPNVFLGRPGLLRFSPENSLLAVSGRSTDIIIYDLGTGKIHSTIDGRGYSAFSFLPDGKTALARDNRYHLRVFDLENGKMLRELKGEVSSSDDASQVGDGLIGVFEMPPVDISPDHKKVLSFTGSRTVQLVDLDTGNMLYEFRNPDKSRAGVMLFKALYGFDRSFLVGITTLRQDTNFTADGKLALVANVSRTATLWDVQSGKLVGQIGPLENTILTQAFSPDDNLLTTTDSDGVTMIWSVPEGKPIATIGNKKDSNYIAAWSPDSRTIWTIAYKEDARAYDARTGKLLQTLSDSRASSVSYSPDRKYLLTKTVSDKESFGSIWEAESGALIAKIPRNKDDALPYVLFFDPTNNYIVSASQKDVKIWSTKGKLLQTLDNAVFPAKFSSDGKLLATGGKNDVGYVWTIK